MPENNLSSVVHVWLGDEDLGKFDFQRISISEGFLIENESGLSVKAFLEGLSEMRAAATQTFVWLLKFRKGERVDRKSLVFDYGDLRMEEEPDPTPASSGEGDAPTSDYSPTTAISPLPTSTD
jgi:hypothetical protein